MKFRVPELLMGALLAACLFAMGFLAASSYYDLRNSSSDHVEQGKGFADDRVANYTLALDWLTGLLAVSTLLLWLSTRRSAQIAERALTELEAPFIGLNIIDGGLTSHQKRDKTWVVEQMRFALTFGFYNHGRTPAVLLSMQDKLQACEESKLPTLEWPGRYSEYPYGVFIGPNMSSAPSSRPFDEYLTGEEWNDVSIGKRNLFLLGRLRFRDIFQNTFEMGFCAVFDPANQHFLMSGGEPYNYLLKVP